MPVETEPWWPEFLALKDAMSLRDLAARFGVGLGALSLALRATNTVRTAMVPAGVSPSPARSPAPAPVAKLSPAPSPAPEPPPAPTSALELPPVLAPVHAGPAGIWRLSVRDDDRPRACIAWSFSEALAHAARIGDVIAVERLGDVLSA